MGRTNPTYRDFLADYEGSWRDYRRALRHDAERDFDRLFERARRYADAAGYANDPHRETLVLVSMLLGQEAALRRLRERVAGLEDAEPDATGTDGDGDGQRAGPG